jgi:hypothetical protein
MHRAEPRTRLQQTLRSDEPRGRNECQLQTTHVFALHVLRAAARAGKRRAERLLGWGGCSGLAAGHWAPHACGRADLGQDADRRASPLPSEISRRCHDGAGTAGRGSAEMVACILARGHGAERDCDRDPIGSAAWGLVRKQCRGGARSGAGTQRVWRSARARPSRPLRPVRGHRAARRARQPQGNRIRLGHAQGGWDRPVDELPGQISRRCFVCPGL